LIANRELAPELAPKAGASDLVQETFLTARRHLRRFRGSSQAEFLAWLRSILINHLLTVRRQFQTEKRQVGREFSLEVCFDRADALARESSPSQTLIQWETAAALATALGKLPQRYQRVILLRHRQQLTFDEVAEQLCVSPQAARQLWVRALRRLRITLVAEGTI
jgi:RNA polymerase sigma-70 factor (ECF subfamily)